MLYIQRLKSGAERGGVVPADEAEYNPSWRSLGATFLGQSPRNVPKATCLVSWDPNLEN